MQNGVLSCGVVTNLALVAIVRRLGILCASLKIKAVLESKTYTFKIVVCYKNSSPNYMNLLQLRGNSGSYLNMARTILEISVTRVVVIPLFGRLSWTVSKIFEISPC
jgi:hypothetical protein